MQNYAPLDTQAITWLQTSTWQPPEGTSNSEKVYFQLERYALASLYFSTTKNDGETNNTSDWDQSDNWLSPSEPVCNWFTRRDDSNNNNDCPGSPLTHLNLSSNNLQGTIPRVLFGLTALTYLDLSSNQLTGSLPDTLGNLGNSIVELRLQENQLTGSIPDSIVELNNLEWLYLQNNQLSGAIPPLPFVDFGCYLDENCFSDVANVEASGGNCRLLNDCGGGDIGADNGAANGNGGV